MLKLPITYEDLDGNKVTEDFYFNVSKVELAKMVMEHGFVVGEEKQSATGVELYLQSIVDSRDGQFIMDEFEKIVKLSYGVRSENGKRFVKNDDVWLDFFQSDAYTVFFMKLVTDATFAAEFVNGIIPKDLQEDVAANLAAGGMRSVEDVELPAPKDPKDMTREELLAAFAAKNQ